MHQNIIIITNLTTDSLIRQYNYSKKALRGISLIKMNWLITKISDKTRTVHSKLKVKIANHSHEKIRENFSEIKTRFVPAEKPDLNTTNLISYKKIRANVSESKNDERKRLGEEITGTIWSCKKKSRKPREKNGERKWLRKELGGIGPCLVAGLHPLSLSPCRICNDWPLSSCFHSTRIHQWPCAGWPRISDPLVVGGDVEVELRPEHRQRTGGVGGSASRTMYMKQGSPRLALWVER